MAFWLKSAPKEIALKASKHKGARPVFHSKEITQQRASVLSEAERWLGSGNMTGRPGQWCAWAVSFWLVRTGHRPLASGQASSALSYGPRLSAPAVGSLIVLPRHVGLVAGVEGDRVTMISGNWGRRVAMAQLSRRAAIAFVAIPN